MNLDHGIRPGNRGLLAPEPLGQRRQRFEGRLQAQAQRHIDPNGNSTPEPGEFDALAAAAQELQQQAASDSQPHDAARRHFHAQARATLNQARRSLYAKWGAPLLREWQAHAEGVAGELHSGRRGIRDIDPDGLSASISYHTGHNAQTLTPDSEVVRAARVVQGAARQGAVGAALSALNVLYGNDLAAYVGQHMHDGSVIAEPARIVGLHPNPARPAQTTIAAQFSVTHPDGRAGSFTRPLMLSGEHLSLHPEDASQHPVLSLDSGEFIHHTLGLASTILATQHPEIQARLRAASPEQSERNEVLLRLGAQLGTRDGDVAPREVVLAPDGSHAAVMGADGVQKRVPLRVGIDDGLPGERGGLSERGGAEQEAPVRHVDAAGSSAETSRGKTRQPFRAGRMYRDKHGNVARYLGGGHWQLG